MIKRARQIPLTALGIAALMATSTPQASALDIRIIDVVSVTWQGAKQPKVSVDDVQRSVSSDVNRNWLSFTSLEGDEQKHSISFQLGRTLENPIVINQPMACEGSASNGFMDNIRSAAYQRLSITNSESRYLIILSPDNGCIWTGRAMIGNIKTGGGTLTLHDTASAFVITHELGHTLGLGHSNFMRCNSGANDGPWGTDCKALEYGGTIDVMGNVETTSTLSTYHQWRLGLLDLQDVRESWLQERIELNASDVVGGTRAIFIRDGKSTYWIEYRRAQASYGAGLAIYRTDPPPNSAIVSPNSQDLESNFDESVSTDMWMLNWDTYRYTGARSSGSMTLPTGKVATFFSKNVSISAEANPSSANKVVVSINRKADTTPPPTPEITDPLSWSAPGDEVLKSPYSDADSVITGYEGLIDSKVVPIDASALDLWKPTYLNPFLPPKRVQLRDLPEGTYMLSIRSRDIWGNVSAWSTPKAVWVDRSEPLISNEFKINSITSSDIAVNWTGARDLGTGLCSTLIHNSDGWVTQRSNERVAPIIRVPLNTVTTLNAQVFDCRGNGKKATVQLDGSITSAQSRSSRTGTWVSAADRFGAGAMQCTSKCTISFTSKGNQSVIMADGAAEVLVNGKTVTKIPGSNTGQIRTSDSMALGSKNVVVRIQGRNFTLLGLSNLAMKVSDVITYPRLVEVVDPSLQDPTQKRLSQLGFRIGDFVQGSIVLPMARGTTLQDPTLDLCGLSYKSEGARESRRQVVVSKSDNSAPQFLSTEVVKYQSSAAAQSALAELRASINQCQKSGGGAENGVFTKYEFLSAPDGVDTSIEDKNRVIVRATIGSGTTARQLLGYFLYRNEYFTGLYLVRTSTTFYTTLEQNRWSQVAATLVSRLATMN